MKDKTCNGGYCNYKTFGASNYGCNYDGYCDYQGPKDSRTKDKYDGNKETSN